MDKRKILLADASPVFCTSLMDFLKEDYDVRICHDGIETLTLVASFEPDVLVMDLSIPRMDGLSVLKELKIRGVRTKVLMTTCFLSDYVTDALKSFGVDMVTMKPCEMHALAERARDLAEDITELSCSLPVAEGSSQILRELNLLPHRRGFLYLEYGIELCVNKPTISITKELYPRVAAHFGTTGQAVERAMRDAINDAWHDRNEHYWRMYFPVGRDGVVRRPTNSQFVCQIAEQLRQQRQQEKAAGGTFCEL